MRNVLYFLISIIFALAVGVLCAIRLYQEYQLYALIFYAVIILALPLSDLIHEVGHIFFGLLVGIKCKPHFSLLGSSQCDLIPHTTKNLRTKLIFVTLGGVLFNFCMLMVGVLSVLKILPIYLCILAPTSAYLYIYNQIPTCTQNGKTDGQVILDLLLLTNEGKVMLSVFMVQSLLISGISIQYIDKELLFNQPIVREDEKAFIILTQLRMEYCRAVGDTENEKKYQNRLNELQDYV